MQLQSPGSFPASYCTVRESGSTEPRPQTSLSTSDWPEQTKMKGGKKGRDRQEGEEVREEDLSGKWNQERLKVILMKKKKRANYRRDERRERGSYSLPSQVETHSVIVESITA